MKNVVPDGEFKQPELPDDPEARHELARQFVGLINAYAYDMERSCRSIRDIVPLLRELMQ